MVVFVTAQQCDRMYRAGRTIRQIAEKLRISQSAVRDRLNEAGTPKRPNAARLQMMRSAKARLDAKKAR